MLTIFAQIAREGSIPDHQYIVKPITGEGRVRTLSPTDK
jgi:hypothetical protein